MAEIFDPIRIGKLEVKNRIMFAATMTSFANPDGSVSDKEVHFLRRIAEGDVGTIVTGHAYVDDVASKGFKHMLGCHTSGLGLNRIAKEVKKYDCACILQLNHVGSKSAPSLIKGLPSGPSPSISYFRERPVEVQMLSIDEIEKIVKAFGEAAARAEEAGFDGVEIHGAHNYLISQFISPNFNFRNDRYGGNLEGRLAFPLELLSSIKSHVSNDFVIGFRLNGQELTEGGLSLEDGVKVAQILERVGITYLNVTQTRTEKQTALTTTYDQPGSFVNIPAKIKENVSIPVTGVGGLHEPELIKKVLKENKMDIVAICRGLIADPDIVKKIKEGRQDEQRICIRCNLCLERTLDDKGIMCTVNPMVGREESWDLKRSLENKNVIIVGGGVAGMEAARFAAMKGHVVTLYEMSDRLGGQAFAASVPKFMEVFKYLLKYYETMLSRLNVHIKLEHKISADEINTLRPDAVILAIGAEEKVPNIPGAKQPHVTTGTSALLGYTQVEGEVAVVGASMIGCQVALYLADEKVCKVRLIARRKKPDFASDLEYTNRIAILNKIENNENIKIYEGMDLQEIKDNTILLKKVDGYEEISVNYVIFAEEFEPRDDITQNMIDKKIIVFRAGDCIKKRNFFSAIHEGANAAYKLTTITTRE